MNRINALMASNFAASLSKRSAIGLLVFLVATFSTSSFALTSTTITDPVKSTQPVSAKYQLEQQTLALVAQMQKFRAAEAANKGLLEQQVINSARQRQTVQFALAKIDPAAAVRRILPETARANIPKEALQYLAHRRQLHGNVEVSYVVNEENRQEQLQYVLRTSTASIPLYFPKNKPPKALKTGNRINVKGWLFQARDKHELAANALVVNDGIEDLELLADSSNTADGQTLATNQAIANAMGEQQTLVLLVNFQNHRVQPWTVEEARQLVFGQVNDYYKEASYGRAWLAGDVHGYITLPVDATCSTSTIDNYGRQALIDNGIDVSRYQRWIYVYPENTDCGWTGKGTIAGSPSRAFINGSMTLRTVGHELGHNLGLYHAKDLDCGSEVIGDNCASAEYGDSMDIMGTSEVTGHFNAFSKQQLGWISAAAGEVITAASDGSYLLEPFETAPSGNPKGIKIQRGVDANTGKPTWYVLEYRQPIGFDGFLEGKRGVTDGVILHLATESKIDSNLLLDMQPDSGLRDLDDAALLVGSSYTDPDAGVTITTEWADATAASINVSYLGLSCIQANPSLSLLPNESAWVEPATNVSYSVTVTNNDSAGCSAGNFSVFAAVPSGWIAQDHSLTLQPGMSKTISLDVQSLASAEDGFYDLNISVVKNNDQAYSETGVVSYVVSSAEELCALAAPSLILSVADTIELAAGTIATFRGTLSSHDSASCVGSDFDISANVPADWSAQSIVVSLSPGESRDIALNVISSASADSGVYNFDITAINRLATGYVASDNATYTVASAIAICERAEPLITVSNPQAEGVAGTQVTYNVSVTNQDSEGCLEADFDVYAEVPSSWSASHSQVKLAAGETAELPISITSATASIAGSFSISVNAQNTEEVALIASDIVSYTVNQSENTAPVAQSDRVALTAKSAVLIDVLANDSDAENDELSIVSVTQGAKGSVEIMTNGQVQYSPAKSFKSSDSFTYAISDGSLTTTATVSLTLTSSGGGSKGKGKSKN